MERISDMTDAEREAEALNCFNLAYSYQMQGELDKAITLYNQSLELHATAEAHTFLGWTYSFQERFAEAIKECFKAIAIDPDYGNPYNDIGSYLIQLDRVPDSIAWFERALEAPRYAARVYPYFNLGRVYEMLHNYPQALIFYRLATQEKEDYLPAYRSWVRLSAMLN